MNADDDRREWRLLWLGSIQAFADSYTQKTRWLEPTERNQHFSFIECMGSYFDDANMREPDAYNKRLAAGFVTSAEVAATAQFHSLSECYESPKNDDYDVQTILRDSKWQEVVAAAHQAQEQLLTLVTEPSEREALSKPLYGRERADADLTTATSLGQHVGSGPRLFAFTKPVSSSTMQIPSDLRRKLVPLGFRAEKSERGVAYRIGPLAITDRSSMFAGFSEVSLSQEDGSWVLRFKLNRALWLIVAFLACALLAKPDQFWKVLAVLSAVVLLSLLWAWVRLSRWWRRL